MKQSKTSKIKSKKRPKNKKSKASYQSCLDLTEKIIHSQKLNFSLVKKIRDLFLSRNQKKNQKDQNIEICKLILKKFFEKKFSFQEAYSIAQISISDSKKIQKKEIKQVLVFFLGGLLMLFFSAVFLYLRFPRDLSFLEALQKPDVLFWIGSLGFFSIVFYFGIKKRKDFDRKTKKLFFLGQASSAYSFAKSPGHGGDFFEAVSYLYKIKAENQKKDPVEQLKNLFKKQPEKS